MRFLGLMLALGCGMATAPGFAQPTKYQATVDKYHVTDVERAACQDDAVALCSTVLPDEDALLVCMKANRTQLSAGCRVTFEQGLRRRHIPF